MDITYSTQKEFTAEQLQDLFASVHSQSAAYPSRLKEGMLHSSLVISAWDGRQLVGLIRCLDDGTTVAFIHYLLVRPDYQKYHIGHALMEQMMEHYADYLYIKIMPSDPSVIPFYEKFGFRQYDNYCAMEVKRLGVLKDH
ncbi:MAG: GNAT family N-acetyltransferase [Solobacterium sp.]|jgi:ribosomal protein S18 acetylase RimI-like enzyme|nr:GNAT family N-acetyltransferase [Solobacterium sp.]